MLTYVVGVSCAFKTYHFAADVFKKVENTSHDIAVFIHLQNGSSWAKMASRVQSELQTWLIVWGIQHDTLAQTPHRASLLPVVV